MNSYLNVVYDEKTKPYTDYPCLLCQYLFKRFGMKKGDKLLDVGCGRGDFTKGFKDLGLEVSGIDWESGNQELLEGIKFSKVNLGDGKFPFEEESFDFVFSKSVIEHFWNPEEFIKESYRILKSKGKMIIMTPDWQSQRCIFYNDYTHCRPYTLISLKNLLKIQKLKDVNTEIFYQLPVLWKYPCLKIFSKFLQFFGPVKKIHKNKFIRWSRELMILATGTK